VGRANLLLVGAFAACNVEIPQPATARGRLRCATPPPSRQDPCAAAKNAAALKGEGTRNKRRKAKEKNSEKKIRGRVPARSLDDFHLSLHFAPSLSSFLPPLAVSSLP
jgi:hypothetical protein